MLYWYCFVWHWLCYHNSIFIWSFLKGWVLMYASLVHLGFLMVVWIQTTIHEYLTCMTCYVIFMPFFWFHIHVRRMKLSLASLDHSNINYLAGLIGAACGQLDTLLQNPSHCSNPTKRHIFSNSFSPVKSNRNTNLKKPVKSLPDRNLYSNGNGVHVELTMVSDE